MKAIVISRQSRRRFMLAAGIAMTSLMIEGLPLTASAANAGKRKIGIVGSGKVGAGIGSVWVKVGHEVMFSSRHIEHDRALAGKLGTNAYAGTPSEAAAFGDVVMISVPYGALPEVGEILAPLVKGKIVIDTCNPFEWRDGEIATWALAQGAGLASAQLVPGARIVRAFNAIGAARMSTAHQDPGRIGMPIAGDDAEAIAVAAGLIREIGYQPVVIGNLEMGRYLMPGTPLSGEHTPEELRKIAATLKP